MSWTSIKREDTFEGSDQPFISIAPQHFSFNTMFSRIAELGPEKRVKIYIDEDNLKLGFEFVNEEEGSYALYRATSSKKGEKRVSMNCTSVAIIKKFPWIEAVANLPDTKDKRFSPKKEGNIWGIQLCPAFEERKARESTNIPSDAVGIYRYLRENGEIVYIGRGNIRDRLNSDERRDWDFDIVEYSIVKDPDEQVKWEAYWLKKYKEKNNGKLPIYNKLSGFESKAS
jgi:hypothetical protein